MTLFHLTIRGFLSIFRRSETPAVPVESPHFSSELQFLDRLFRNTLPQEELRSATVDVCLEIRKLLNALSESQEPVLRELACLLRHDLLEQVRLLRPYVDAPQDSAAWRRLYPIVQDWHIGCRVGRGELEFLQNETYYCTYKRSVIGLMTAIARRYRVCA